jgi:hypothetical protein
MTWKSKSNPTTIAQVEDKPIVLAKVGVIKEMRGNKFKPSLHDFARMA